MTISMAAVDPQRACPELEQLDALGRLRWGVETFGDGFALTTSFGIQAAVSLHLISRLDRRVPVIWVDTGYLPPETYTYAAALMEQLGLQVHVAQSTVSPARRWATEAASDQTLPNSSVAPIRSPPVSPQLWPTSASAICDDRTAASRRVVSCSVSPSTSRRSSPSARPWRKPSWFQSAIAAPPSQSRPWARLTS